MRTVTEIYDGYRIPPWLQLHQLRVAAVGKVVAESIEGTDVYTIVSACLLHDMGAIVKFNFFDNDPRLKRFYDQGGIGYWIQVQEEFRVKYGEKEHEATDRILQEMQVPDAVRILIGGTGLAKAKDILEKGTLELQVVEYSDMRIGLNGVLSLADRLADMKKRYEPRWGKDSYIEREAQFDTSASFVMALESKLFGRSSLQPSDIDDELITSMLEELRTHTI